MVGIQTGEVITASNWSSISILQLLVSFSVDRCPVAALAIQTRYHSFIHSFL